MTKLRCAIYTRKSSDEGLEQEFSSLDAQRDACRSYIESQRHEGWSRVRQRYDDGGFSGGNMHRPGLKKLMSDIERGKIDVVVIYKIDRLTRSLADFARIVEQFEKANVSFVSVTQSFNTKTSMGRLMLHVLLSFAQFEREVGAERVRDKIAASKAKGMWMGGTIPLGYDVRDRKLVINEAEAETARAIIAKFAELRSVPATVEWANGAGLKTKISIRKGKRCGGKKFGYGSMRALLSNRLYAGQVEHKGKVYEGQQSAIFDRGLFEEVQAILASRSTPSMRGAKICSDSMLQGLIKDDRGRSMGPVHTVRRGQRYRYYVTHSKTIDKDNAPALRMPADALEQECCALLIEHWRSGVSSIDDDQTARERSAELSQASPAEKKRIAAEHFGAVEVGKGRLRIALKDGTTLERSIAKVRHGNDAQIVVGECNAVSAKAEPQLLKLMQDAWSARELALAKPMTSLPKLAKQFGRSTERFKRLIRLSYLSPNIVSAIVEGRAEQILSARDLQNLNGIPLDWDQQEDLILG